MARRGAADVRLLSRNGHDWSLRYSLIVEPVAAVRVRSCLIDERTVIGHRHLPFPQSSSASRRTAGAAGFLIFSQSFTRPERYVEPSRFDTMPSQPSAQACL